MIGSGRDVPEPALAPQLLLVHDVMPGALGLQSFWQAHASVPNWQAPLQTLLAPLQATAQQDAGAELGEGQGVVSEQVPPQQYLVGPFWSNVLPSWQSASSVHGHGSSVQIPLHMYW